MGTIFSGETSFTAWETQSKRRGPTQVVVSMSNAPPIRKKKKNHIHTTFHFDTNQVGKLYGIAMYKFIPVN